MKVIICGDRNWTDYEYLCDKLHELHEKHKFTLVIEGEARGADILARRWAESRGIPVKPCPADWQTYHRAAGPIRNREMLNLGPDLVVGFHNNIQESKGTKDMLKLARKNNVETLLFPEGQTF